MTFEEFSKILGSVETGITGIACVAVLVSAHFCGINNKFATCNLTLFLVYTISLFSFNFVTYRDSGSTSSVYLAGLFWFLSSICYLWQIQYFAYRYLTVAQQAHDGVRNLSSRNWKPSKKRWLEITNVGMLMTQTVLDIVMAVLYVLAQVPFLDEAKRELCFKWNLYIYFSLNFLLFIPTIMLGVAVWKINRVLKSKIGGKKLLVNERIMVLHFVSASANTFASLLSTVLQLFSMSESAQQWGWFFYNQLYFLTTTIVIFLCFKFTRKTVLDYDRNTIRASFIEEPQNISLETFEPQINSSFDKPSNDHAILMQFLQKKSVIVSSFISKTSAN